MKQLHCPSSCLILLFLVSFYLFIAPYSYALSAGVIDSLPKAKHPRALFIRAESGLGTLRSAYTSEVVTGGPGGFNNVDDYQGSGYQIPVAFAAGYRHHNFSAGIGITVQYFHAATLTRNSYALDSTNATGAPVKHQVAQLGKNYIIPLFLEYRFVEKGHLSCGARLVLGAFFHDRNAYDGTYAPSSSAEAFGHSFSFGFTPTYSQGPWSFFLHPHVLLTQISYHGSSNEELTDLGFNLGLGIEYHLH